MRISIDSCCRYSTETPVTPFFSTVLIIPCPVDLLGKEIGIHRHFHRPITGYNKYRYSIHQPVDRPTGVFNRLLYRDLYLLLKQDISIDNFTYLLVKQQVDIDRKFHVHWSQYQSAISRAYWLQE